MAAAATDHPTPSKSRNSLNILVLPMAKGEIEFKAPSEDDIPDLAVSIMESFKDYYVPMVIDEAVLRAFIQTYDIDLGLSVVALDRGGSYIGQSLTGRRGDRTWVAATGIRPDTRDKGIGLGMLARQIDVIRSVRAREVALEVLVQNVKAKRIYQGAGFKRRRDLYSFRRLGSDDAPSTLPDHLRFEPCNVKDVLDLYRPDHPWQSMAESIANMEGTRAFLSFLTEKGGPTMAEGVGHYSTDPMDDLHDGADIPDLPETPDMEVLTQPHGPELEGYCIYQEKENEVLVLDIYSVGNSRDLLGHLLSSVGNKVVMAKNVFDAMSVMAYETMGFERWHVQHEMRMDL